VVIVTRKTPLELLTVRHGTIAQAEFYLRSRGEDIAGYREMHERLEHGLDQVVAALPADLRRTRVDREQLDRFQFASDDIVLIVGQDGLVPNTAKYLGGQLTLGINPDPARYDGVLCSHPPGRVPELLAWLRDPAHGSYRVQRRTMLLAEREDGQTLLALNEVFVGHQTHQSARYRLRTAAGEERHSSSGVICATGTGCTGWARSIARQRNLERDLPGPEENRGVWFVREPFPSVHTQVALDFGSIQASGGIELFSEMAEGGVAFADGIESDRLEFADGQSLRLRVAPQKLALVVPSGPGSARRGRRSPRRPAAPGASDAR
jgi:NAD kinase